MPLYEIYLPLAYNDRCPVEQEKLNLTRQELIDRFTGLTSTPPRYPLQGWWHSEHALVRDDIIIYTVLTQEDENGFFKWYKEVLRQRFRQEEIFILKIPAHSL